MVGKSSRRLPVTCSLLLFPPYSDLSVQPSGEGRMRFSDHTIIHRYIRILANNMDHADSDIPSAYLIKNHMYEAAYEAKAAYEATMQARAISRETNTVNDPCVAKTNQTQSMAGFERTKANNLVDLSQRNGANSCTKNEAPHSNINMLTALMDYLHLDTENNMTHVPLSSDDESEDGWSVVSGGSDFVIIDSAETARHISNDRSKKKKPEVPPRLSRKARPNLSSVDQQSMVADQNDREEPVTESAVDDSRTHQLELGRQRDHKKLKGKWLDRLSSRHGRFERKMERAFGFEARVLREACRQERDGEIDH